MNSIELLGPFLGKVVVDIQEYDELDAYQSNHTFIKIILDDDSFICFPMIDQKFWYSYE